MNTDVAIKTERQVALITGASRGIGEAVAKRFAQEGMHVILLARDQNGLEALDDWMKAHGADATLVPMDITDGAALDRLGAEIASRFGRLDVLVGNAAILGELTPLPHISPNLWDNVLNTNLNANFRLIRSFDSLLRASKNGRAMFVTSGVAADALPFWGAYAVSKAALEMMVQIYARELEHTSVRINLIDPGVVRTLMRSQAMPGEDQTHLPAPDDITDIFLALSQPYLRATGQIFYTDTTFE
jgi:NAD(P)-dependent dehydrogenase (short-subunit alcohol dehydrogenase family)